MTVTDTDKNPEEATVTKDDVLYYEEYKPPFMPLLVLVFPLLPLFWKYHVRVTADELQFGYSSSLSRKTVARTDVVRAEPIQRVNGLTQYGGWGIKLRLNFSGELGYIAKNGPAVRVILRTACGTKTKTYVFNCAEPQKVCDLLNKNDASYSGNEKSQ